DYYRAFTKDSLFYKCLVGLLFAVTVLQCTMDFKILYRCTVEFYGNFDKFDDTDWTLWWEIAVTAIIGAMSQSFFLERCWGATKSWIVLIVGGAGILTSLASGIASTIMFQNIQRLSRVPEIPGPILVFLIGTAVVDLGIAAVLVWSITRVKSKFRKTETIIGRIIRITFQTSALTATIAVLNVVLYLTLPGEAYHLLPQLIMGKIYVISVMVTLSARSAIREILEQSAGTSYQATRRDHTTIDQGASKLEFASASRIASNPAATSTGTLGGIQVSTTTYIHNDEDNVDTDSTRKVRTNSDIELGPIPTAKTTDMRIPIQYPPDGIGMAVRGGKDDLGSMSDEEDDWKNGRGTQ
ncbi:hypothetical protein FRB90_006204, partial [Tulasnella sp. 427]